MRLMIKYCGGCNPIIKRKELAETVLTELRKKNDVELVSESADIALVVGGCPVCCVDLQPIRDQAEELFIVGGNLVNFIQVDKEQLPDQIISGIEEKLRRKEVNRIEKLARVL